MGHGKPPPRRCGKGYRTGRYSKPIVAPRARGKKLRRGGGGPQWLSHIVFFMHLNRAGNSLGAVCMACAWRMVLRPTFMFVRAPILTAM